MKQKRILTIQDISCVGRCSLTVALPIISSAGIEASIIPTAVLSTHTGGFENYTFKDLTDEIMPITNHWESLGLTFDAIYTGYLGSFEQIDIVAGVFDRFKSDDNFIVVDPAMADGGKLYGGFPEDFPKGMANLCEKADIIVPNMTEAAFMLDKEYIEEGYDKEYVEDMVMGLYNLGPSGVIITGISFDPDKLGIVSYDGKEMKYYFTHKINGYFHGTGDVYASSFLAAYIKKNDLYEAASIAADFTVKCIDATDTVGEDRKFGVNFESCLGDFIGMLKK